MKRFFAILVSIILALVVMTSAVAGNTAATVSHITPMVGINVINVTQEVAPCTSLISAAMYARYTEWYAKQVSRRRSNKKHKVARFIKTVLLLPLMPIIGIGFGEHTNQSERPDLGNLQATVANCDAAWKHAVAERDALLAQIASIGESAKAEATRKHNEACEAKQNALAKMNNLHKSILNLSAYRDEIEKELDAARRNLSSKEISKDSVIESTFNPEENAFIEELRTKEEALHKKALFLQEQVNSGNVSATRLLARYKKEWEVVNKQLNRTIIAHEATVRFNSNRAEQALAVYDEYTEASSGVAEIETALAEIDEIIETAKASYSKAVSDVIAAEASVKLVASQNREATKATKQHLMAIRDKLPAAYEEIMKARSALESAERDLRAEQEYQNRVDAVGKTIVVLDGGSLPKSSDTIAEAEVSKDIANNGMCIAITCSNAKHRKVRGRTWAQVKAIAAPLYNEMDPEHRFIFKVCSTRDGITNIVFARWGDNGSLETIKDDGVETTFDSTFASKIVAHNKRNTRRAADANVNRKVDHHGRGSYSKYQVAVFGPTEEVEYSENFDNAALAEEVFAEKNLGIMGGYYAVLREDCTITRYTGDKQDRNTQRGWAVYTAVFDILVAAGLGEKYAEAVCEYFSLNTRQGESDLARIVREGDAEALKTIKGIGAKRSQIILRELKGKLTQWELPENGPAERYVSIRKVEYDGKTCVDKFVNVKRSTLYDYLRKVSAERGIDPDKHPVYMYMKTELSRKLNDKEAEYAKKKVSDRVHAGLRWLSMKYYHTLHGTNAARTCTMCLVREDLMEDAINFCLADADKGWATTAAKRNAYAGLQLPGTDRAPFKMDARWIHIAKSLKVTVEDECIRVNGKIVSDPEMIEFVLNITDGAAIEEYTDKLIDKIIAEQAPNDPVKARAIRQWCTDRNCRTMRDLAMNKGLCIRNVLAHQALHDMGVHELGGVDIDYIAIFTTDTVFKGKIGENGTHATKEDYNKACDKYGYTPASVLHGHPMKRGNLSSQQLQSLAGIKEETVLELVKESAALLQELSEHPEEIAPNKTLGEMLKSIPQIAAEKATNERLQEAYAKLYNLGFYGKLYGAATSAFVGPDPRAMLTWIAYEDMDKVQYAIDRFHVWSDDPMLEDNREYTVSRNPSTDPTGQCNVIVVKSLGEWDKYIVPGGNVVFISCKDTLTIRLRMDCDGDHIVICILKKMPDAVREMISIWFPECKDKNHGPCFDWEPEEANKKVLSDEDLLKYFSERTDGGILGTMMDLLTTVLNSIACGTLKITPEVRGAVAWLTYAVNILVDAAKHGGVNIEELMPDSVKKLRDQLKLPKTAGVSKMADGKDVDLEKVYDELGKGVLDTIARLWEQLVPKEYTVKYCDYTKPFDPRYLLSERRAEETGDLINDCLLEDRSILIWDFTGEYKWKFIPYIKESGNIRPELAQPSEAIKFVDYVLDENGIPVLDKRGNPVIDKTKRHRINKSELSSTDINTLTEYIQVVDGETTAVMHKVWVKQHLVENKQGTYDVVPAHWDWEIVPGKWVSRFCKSEPAKADIENLASSSPVPFFCCLEQSRHEIENTFEVEGDAYDRKRAAADRAESRKFTSWATRHECLMYGAQYGASKDEVLDKLILWAFRPREEGASTPSTFATDLVLDSFSKEIVARAKKSALALYSMAKVRFATSNTLYGYLTKNLVKPGMQVVVPDVRGGNQILDVVESCQMTEQELETYARQHGFDPAGYKWAEVYTA